MYTSKYYTCEQIDQRLLQGYYDDAVAAGYKGTKDEFVSGLNNAVSKAIDTAKAISFDPTHTMVDFKTVQAALEELLQDVGRVDITELDSMTSADHAKSKGPIFYKVTASFGNPKNKMNVGILLVNSDNLGHLLRQTLLTQYLLTEEGAIDTTAHDHEFHEYTRYHLFHSEEGTESTWTAWEDIFGNINKEVKEVANKKADKAAVDSELAKKFDKESVVQELGDAEDKVMSQKFLTEKFNSLRNKIYDYIPKVSKNEFIDIPLSLKQGDSFLITVSYPNTVPVYITLMKDEHTYKDTLYSTNNLYLITNDTDFDVIKIRITIRKNYAIDDETIAQVSVSQDANSIGIANSLADISGKCYDYIPKVSKNEFIDIPLSLKKGETFAAVIEYPNTVPVYITLMKDEHTYKDSLYMTNNLYLITNDTDFDVIKIRITIKKNYAIDDSSKAKVYVASKGLSLGIIKKISDIESSNNEEKDRHYKLAKVIRKNNMDEWSNLQFGMFIHWGVYSVYGGSYNGTDVNGNPISTTSEREWLMQHKLIPKNDYMRKGAEFASDKWNPELICALAKSVGMKYIILTVRHHEGFSLYPSEYCDWNISQTKASQDVVMQLKKACEKNGIKFGIYYSYFLNWTEEGGYGQENWNNGRDPYSNEQHTAFVKKQINYVNELNSVFEPYIIWYDNGTAGASKEMQKLFYDNQKMNYPTVIFNNRGCIENGYISDEDTYSESIDASSKRERATGLPAWGYNSTLDVKESTYPKLGDKIFDIVRTISRGYNYLLNIGPDGHGEVPPLTVSWLGKLAKFSREYFTLNGSKGLLWQCNPEWGRIVNKGNTLYLMVHPSFTSIYLDSVYTPNIKGVHIYGVEDSDSNYSIEDDYRIKITNLSPISEYGYSFVRVDLYSEASALDYICIDSSIKPMQLVRTKYSAWKYSGAEWNKYTMNNGSNAVSCRFKWIGDSGEYKLKLDADLTNNQSFKVAISDKSGTILSSNSIGKNEEGETLETTEFVNMTKDDIYTFSLERITNDATSIIRSVQFIRKEL